MNDSKLLTPIVAQQSSIKPQTDPSSLWIYIGLGVAISILLFVILRAVMLWYWKVNDILDLLMQIELNTRKAPIQPGAKIESK